MPDPAPDNPLPLVGISMGDPLGVGPEVIVKALNDPALRQKARFVILGQHDVLEYAADQAEIQPYWWREPYDGRVAVRRGMLVADFDELSPLRVNGQREPNEIAGQASYRFVEEGVRLLKEDRLDALVTGPICKQAWHMARVRLRGHTEMLSIHFNTKRVTMSFVADDLRIALASDHLPLMELRNTFTIGLVHQPIDLLDQALRDWFGIRRPRIGVLGLNPHAGEDGLLGDEERRIIEPALAMARNNGIDVTGPLSPDTAFLPHVRARFDGLVAMYHDQGLIPLKMTAFDRAVNVTLGLPVVRTSPDHGTAFDIAGRNQASPGSMTAAIELAIKLANRRRERRTTAPEDRQASTPA